MIFRSPFPDIAIPDVSLTSFVLRRAGELRDKPALIDGPSGRTLTYGQLADGIRRTAVGLSHHGFRQGDVLATICPSIPEFAVAFYAASALGGTTTMLNPLFTVDELATQLSDAGARFVLTVPERIDLVREAVGLRVQEIFVAGEAAGATPFAALQTTDGEIPAREIVPAADIALLPYSSGTTGRQKGVMLTHQNLIATVLIWQAADGVGSDDVAATVYPFFHIGGIFNLNVFLSNGATLVIMPRYDLRSFLQMLEDHHVTRATLTPPVILDLVRQPIVDDYDLSRFTLIHWAAAPMGEDLARACRERLGCRVKQLYGMTEAVPTHTVPIESEDRPGSCGPLVPNTACKVIDVVTGAELEPGETGEICVQGPQVMQGYWNRPDATSASIDGDGWLHTGDLGYVDADGWLYIVDRLKELIKYKAYQVAPAELEAVLLAHPAVADVAVIPSPDEAAGEVPKAFVVPRHEIAADDLMAFVAARVAPYKKIRRLEFIEQIPKSASGKILRRVLVERERAALPVPVLVLEESRWSPQSTPCSRGQTASPTH
jgi:acyl-CoA synthetase (AMP-forming)/AMP-acid ligase II